MALARRVNVFVAPLAKDRTSGDRRAAIDLVWLLKTLGAENVTSLLVEGGGEVNALIFAWRVGAAVAFFYAPKILGGRDSRRSVGRSRRRANWNEVVELLDPEWRKIGPDLLLTARVAI